MASLKDLRGKVAVVTGAARNLGAGIARMLARRGAHVVIHHHDIGSLALVEALAEEIDEERGQATLLDADLAQPGDVERFTREIDRRFGRYDILINNAGLIVRKPWPDLTHTDFDRVFAVNARAPFMLMQHAAKAINDGGRIVNIATSILGMAIPGYTVYAASKSSLEHFARTFATEFRQRGITANTIGPGAMDTPFLQPAGEGEGGKGVPGQMTGRLGSIEDVVPMVGFLVSAEAHWVTGQTMVVDGGLTLR
jgi:NAD(P)-dependent dehydrogenase (short-subunit alcohol dehydrogenase family)